MCSVDRVTWPAEAAPVGARHRPGVGLHATHVEGQHRLMCLHQCQHIPTTLTGGHLGLSPGSAHSDSAMQGHVLRVTHTRISLDTRTFSVTHLHCHTWTTVCDPVSPWYPSGHLSSQWPLTDTLKENPKLHPIYATLKSVLPVSNSVWFPKKVNQKCKT